jgi:WhiB family redox-sensing transcriptional regulator
VTTAPEPRLDDATGPPLLDGIPGHLAGHPTRELSLEHQPQRPPLSQRRRNLPPGAPRGEYAVADRLHFLADRQAELGGLVGSSSLTSLNHQLRDAACRGTDTELYFPDDGEPGELALARCAGCQARLACLALALRTEDSDPRYGWFGGLGPADRDAVASSLIIKKSVSPALDPPARAIELRAVGWTVDAIASSLGCSRRTVQRYCGRKPAVTAS